MNITGRNKIKGKVVKAIPGIVGAEVEIDAGNGIRVVGLITKVSLDELQIKEGDELTALVKATSVMFIKDGVDVTKITGRNKIKGKVVKVIPGVVSAEVEVDAGNGIKVVGLITKGSLDELHIKEGDTLTALIKATSVMFIK